MQNLNHKKNLLSSKLTNFLDNDGIVVWHILIPLKKFTNLQSAIIKLQLIFSCDFPFVYKYLMVLHHVVYNSTPVNRFYYLDKTRWLLQASGTNNEPITKQYAQLGPWSTHGLFTSLDSSAKIQHRGFTQWTWLYLHLEHEHFRTAFNANFNELK